MFNRPRFTLILGLTASLLLGCGGGTTNQYLFDIDEAQGELRSNARIIEVSRLDLPQHANENEISLRGPDGVIRILKNDLWADSPDQALTELLAAGLDERLTADVVASPWPYDTPADLRVDVKVRELIGDAGSQLNFKGQYFLSSPGGGALAKPVRFEYVLPMNDASPQSLSNAYAQAFAALSNAIASSISKVSIL